MSHFFRNTLLSAFAFAAAATTAQAQHAPPATEQSGIYQLHTGTPAPTVFPRQYTIAADTNHGDIKILREFRDTFRNFIRDGGTDIVIESDSVYQDIFDRIKSGQNTMKDYSDVLPVASVIPRHKVSEAQTIFQDIMQMALDNNIRFHAIDQDPAVLEEMPDVAWTASISSTDIAAQKSFSRKMNDPDFTARVLEFNAKFKAQRRAMDAELIKLVKGLGPQAKIIIFYGANHAPYLAEGLGHSSTQGIFILTPGKPYNAAYERLPLANFRGAEARPTPQPASPAP